MQKDVSESSNAETIEWFNAEAAHVARKLSKTKMIFYTGYLPDGTGPTHSERQKAEEEWLQSSQKLLEILVVLFQTVGGKEALTIARGALKDVKEAYSSNELIENKQLLIKILVLSTTK